MSILDVLIIVGPTASMIGIMWLWALYLDRRARLRARNRVGVAMAVELLPEPEKELPGVVPTFWERL